jgi:hypothetical protein
MLCSKRGLVAAFLPFFCGGMVVMDEFAAAGWKIWGVAEARIAVVAAGGVLGFWGIWGGARLRGVDAH